jgi:hypothetical protein
MVTRRLLYRSLLILLLVGFGLLSLPSPALAQTYYFQVPQETVRVYWNEDGTASIDYVIVFTNESPDSAIEYVDIGIPNVNFNVNTITADVDGRPLDDISVSGYQGNGRAGVAIGLGQAIPRGRTGTLHVSIGEVRRVLYPDDNNAEYASAVFAPTYFGSAYVHGATDLSVTFYLPPGVQPQEPFWHAAPAGFPSQPVTALDDQGRVVYGWRNTQANAHTYYEFGASFPTKYVPASAIVRRTFLDDIGDWIGENEGCMVMFGFVAFFAGITGWSAYSSSRRKLKYLPPKISIEGHGIKRGLTAVEAALLMEQPMDKVLTMILFGVVKKNAARVLSRDPLQLEIANPLPEGMQPYEQDFIAAFKEKGAERQKALKTAIVAMLQALAEKMKGFSRKETIAYYQEIMRKAWAQVEAANTPEVKGEKFGEVLEWTMLDRKYDDHTRQVFGQGPVFLPRWWGHYDPVIGHSSIPRTGSAAPSVPSARTSLPGADFATSVIHGVQSFSSKAVGNITDFTSGITQRTNPVPVSTSSGSSRSSSGGRSCACACACAGCACACAGGGR